MSSIIKGPVETLQWFWNVYRHLRDSPETVGPSRAHKIAVFLMYVVSGICALHMVLVIFKHRVVFHSLTENTKNGKAFEIPSLIVCPKESQKYNYSFFHESEWISDLGLSVDAVNILAKAAKENTLESVATNAALAAETRLSAAHVRTMTPKQMWINITTWMYHRAHDYSKIAVYTSGGLKGNVPFSCHDDTTSVLYYGCRRIQGIWLTDDSYCFLWNNTGRKLVETETENSRMRFLPKFRTITSYRIWLGDILFTPIYFDKIAFKTPKQNIDYYVKIYNVDGKAQKICQPLLEQFCNDSVNQKSKSMHIHNDNYWVFVISKQIYGIHTDFSKSEIESKISAVAAGQDTSFYFRIIFEGTSWFHLKRIEIFTPMIVAQTVGNMFGIWIGFSMMAMVKTGLVFAKSVLHLQLQKKFTLFVQLLLFAILAACTVLLQYWNYAALQRTRFVNELDVEMDKGAPYPNFHFCPRFLTVFNYTEIKKYHISYPLLTYITATAILQRPVNYIELSQKKFKEAYFLYDKKSSPEIGYHWNFMQFPLQYVSHETYEAYMEKVEEEYEVLAETLSVSPASPSWVVMKKLILNPCKTIKFCHLNGKLDKSCCHHFRIVMIDANQHFHACWMFDNKNLALRQTHAGREYGFRVALDMNELQHAMPHLWLDDYLAEYAKNCSVLYNCSTKYPKIWNPYSALTVRMNDAQVQTALAYIRGPKSSMKAGKMQDIQLSLTKNSRLEYRDSNNCSSQHKPIHNILPFIKQEIVKKKCGCYICHDPPIYYTQTKPCCTPNAAGRCLTQMDMHESLCYEKDSGKYKNFQGVNRLQHQYAGNLPSAAPVNPLLHHTAKCHYDALFHDPKSKFYEIHKAIISSLPQFKTACKSLSVQAQKLMAQKNENPVEQNVFVFNFYYPVVQYMKFSERDLLNFRELFGLFCGALGFCFGITFIDFSEILVLVMEKTINCIRGNRTSELSGVSSNISYWSLRKFANRFQYFMKNVTETAAAVPPKHKNVVTVDSLDVNCRLDHLAATASDTPSQVDQEGKKISLNQVEENNKTIKLGKSSVVEKAEMDCSEADPHPSAQSRIYIENLFCIILLVGVGLAIIGCAQLHQSMELDKTTVQFDIQESGIRPPNIGICLKRHSRSAGVSFHQSQSQNQIITSLLRCELLNNVVDCKNLFSVFLRTEKFDCAFSVYDFVDMKIQHSGKSELQVKVANRKRKFYVWAGDLKTINNGILTAEHALLKGKILSVRYQQWEVVESGICGTNVANVPCYSCSRQKPNNEAWFCCLDNRSLNYNMTASLQRHCSSSFYEIAAHNKASSSDHSQLHLISAANVKRVVRREHRRTISEKAMLYAGYIDLFVGVNADNIIFAVTAIITAFCFKRKAGKH